MTQIKRFNFSNDKQITAQIADSINNFLWIGYAKNSSGNCIIKKTAKFKPTQTYFSLEREVDKVVSFDLNSTLLLVSYEDSELLGEIITKTNPLSSTIEIDKNSYIENPVDAKINNSNIWFLLPGSLSGTNSKLLQYNTSGVFQKEVDLIKSGEIVTNAISMVIDSNDDIWIVTHTDPSTLIRVFDTGGGIYDFAITEII